MIEEIKIFFDKENESIMTSIIFDESVKVEKRTWSHISYASKDFLEDDCAKIQMAGIFVENAYSFLVERKKKEKGKPCG